MEIHYCIKCKKRVSSYDIEEGRGVELNSKIYCSECVKELNLVENGGKKHGPYTHTPHRIQAVPTVHKGMHTRHIPGRGAGRTRGSSFKAFIFFFAAAVLLLIVLIFFIALQKPDTHKQASQSVPDASPRVKHRDTRTDTQKSTLQAVHDSVETDEDSEVVVNVLDNDRGEAVSLLNTGVADHGSVTKSGNTVKYTPSSNFHGTDTFVYTATDIQGHTSRGTVTVTVKPLNDPPVLRETHVTGIPGNPVDVSLEAIDPDGDALEYIIEREPLHGTLSGKAPSLIYTPEQDFKGKDEFRVKASDGRTESAVVTVTITVQGVTAKACAVPSREGYAPLAVSFKGGATFNPVSVNFNEFPVLGGDTKQDMTPRNFKVFDNGTALFLWGNTWKLVKLPYKVTKNTILEFDFKSTYKGEAHAIGFVTDRKHDAPSDEKKWFKLFGTQEWHNEAFAAYRGNGRWQHFRIPAGKHVPGSCAYLGFMVDDDDAYSGTSMFRNIHIYEKAEGNFTYSWDFGDGTGSDEKDPAHTYNTPGTYEAVLTVSKGGTSIQDRITVTAERTPEQAVTSPRVAVRAEIDPYAQAKGKLYKYFRFRVKNNSEKASLLSIIFNSGKKEKFDIFKNGARFKVFPDLGRDNDTKKQSIVSVIFNDSGLEPGGSDHNGNKDKSDIDGNNNIITGISMTAFFSDGTVLKGAMKQTDDNDDDGDPELWVADLDSSNKPPEPEKTREYPAGLDKGLAGYLTFDEGGGNMVADSSGNGNSGTRENGPEWTEGRFGKALRFNGNNTFVSLQKSSALNKIQHGSFTLSAWFKPSEIPSGRSTSHYAIIMKRGMGLHYTQRSFKMSMPLGSGQKAVWSNAETGAKFDPGTFYHVAGVVDREKKETRIYVNGNREHIEKLPASGTPSVVYTRVPWRIGIRHPNEYARYKWPAKGIIDEIRIYSRALTDQEILRLYGSSTGASAEDTDNRGEPKPNIRER